VKILEATTVLACFEKFISRFKVIGKSIIIEKITFYGIFKTCSNKRFALF